jgi:hypothetical protein
MDTLPMRVDELALGRVRYVRGPAIVPVPFFLVCGENGSVLGTVSFHICPLGRGRQQSERVRGTGIPIANRSPSH